MIGHSAPGHINGALSLDRVHSLRQVVTSLGKSASKKTSIQDMSRALAEYVSERPIDNLSALIGLFLRWEGKPFTLDRHYQFEPILNSTVVPNMVWMTGRQLGKTVIESVEALIRCATLRDPRVYSHMFVTPLFDQVRRISNDHIRPMLEDSPLRTAWIGRSRERSVLRRVFKNGAKMIFTFAYTSADRIRGNSVDGVTFDEVQDFREEFFPVVEEVVSASPFKVKRYFGTAKGSDTTLARLWGDSSQAEWVVPCTYCNFKNIPSLQYHLLAMIGPLRDDISAEKPATICANPKCRRIIHPRLGRWWHRYEEKSVSFPGHHLPQPIMETHYANRNNWKALLDKQAGRKGWTTAKVNNEVFGEPTGAGVELIAEEELKRAAVLPWTNHPEDPGYARTNRAALYKDVVMSADWGGGGEDGTSRTCLGTAGLTFDHKIDIIWGKLLPNPHAHIEEAMECMRHFKGFKPKLFAHDFTGAGSLRETVMVRQGFPQKLIVPFWYVRSSKQKIVRAIKPTKQNPRRYFQIDKARAMLQVIAGIKTGAVRFFRYDYHDRDDPGLIRHFLALTERKNEENEFTLQPSYSIGRYPGRSDDFAQMVMLACACLWERHNCWPSLEVSEHMRLTRDQERNMAGEFEEADMEGADIQDDEEG